jgi:hypothetical protein
MEIKINRLRRNHGGIKCLFEDNYKINVWFYLLKLSTNRFMKYKKVSPLSSIVPYRPSNWNK